MDRVPNRGSAADAPLDMEQLVRRCMGRIELAERLLKSFESRFPEELTQIEVCLEENDSTALSRLVHQLKGAAANISAPDLHAILTRMEHAVRSEQPEAARTCVEEVHEAWDRFLVFKSTAANQANRGCI
jgi:HPt (histidine-containing phosphotransfer) domain-containing protein